MLLFYVNLKRCWQVPTTMSLSTFSIQIVLLILLVDEIVVAQNPSKSSPPHPYSPLIFLDAAQSVLDVGRFNKHDHEEEIMSDEIHSIIKMEKVCELHRYTLRLASLFDVTYDNHNDDDDDDNNDFDNDKTTETRCQQLEGIQFRHEQEQFERSLVQVPSVSKSANKKSLPPWRYLCDLAGMMDVNTIQLDMLITEHRHTFDEQYHSQALLLMTETDNFFRVVQAQGACGSNSISEYHGNAPNNITKVIIQMKRMTDVLIHPSTLPVIVAAKEMFIVMALPQTKFTLAFARKLNLLNYALNNVKVALEAIKTASSSSSSSSFASLLSIEHQVFNAATFVAELHAETLTKHRDFEGLDHGYVLLLNSVEVIRTFMRKTKTLVEELPSCTGNTYNKSSTTHVQISQKMPPLTKDVILWNGVRMPRIAFGTAHNGSPVELFFPALKDGYRHFDLAQGYGDMEQNFGRFIGHLNSKNLTRSDLFITSKLTYMVDFNTTRVRKAVNDMLKRMRCDHLDLLLLHSWQHFKWNDVLDAWKIFEELYDEGIVRAIGLSNVEVGHLHWLLPQVRIKPMVVQNLGNIFYPHVLVELPDVVSFCASHNIVVSSYSSVGTSDFSTLLPAWQDSHVKAVADFIGKSPGEVALHWAMRRGGAVVTQSLNPIHRLNNLHVHNLPILPWHQSYLDMIAPMYHCQQLKCGTMLSGTPFQEFKCGTKVRIGTPHVVGTFLQMNEMADELEKLYIPLREGTALQVQIEGRKPWFYELEKHRTMDMIGGLNEDEDATEIEDNQELDIDKIHTCRITDMIGGLNEDEDATEIEDNQELGEMLKNSFINLDMIGGLNEDEEDEDDQLP